MKSQSTASPLTMTLLVPASTLIAWSEASDFTIKSTCATPSSFITTEPSVEASAPVATFKCELVAAAKPTSQVLEAP